jgi:hypothetical protein
VEFFPGLAMERKSPQIVGGGVVTVVAAEEESGVAAVICNAYMARYIVWGRSAGRDTFPRRKRDPSMIVCQEYKEKKCGRSCEIYNEWSHLNDLASMSPMRPRSYFFAVLTRPGR